MNIEILVWHHLSFISAKYHSKFTYLFEKQRRKQKEEREISRTVSNKVLYSNPLQAIKIIAQRKHQRCDGDLVFHF